MGQGVKSHYQITQLIAPEGERVPLLVERVTGIPTQLATRYLITDLRQRGQAAATLRSKLRAIQDAYEWARQIRGTSLDELLVSGRALDVKEYRGLSAYIKQGGAGALAGRSPEDYNRRWLALEQFLVWHAGQYNLDAQTQRQRALASALAQEEIRRRFGHLRHKERLSPPVTPLSDEEWAALEAAIATERDDIWPDVRVRYRNHAMVYLIAGTGMRSAEALKLTLADVPIGQDRYLIIRRNPDDRDDPRRETPEVKTQGRLLPIGEGLAGLLGRYATEYRYRSTSKFLWVSLQGGAPLAPRSMRQIMERLSAATGHHLRWHRLRHMFLNRLKMDLKHRANGNDVLKEIAGWRSEESAEDYTRLQVQRDAGELLRGYQGGLYPPPGKP